MTGIDYGNQRPLVVQGGTAITKNVPAVKMKSGYRIEKLQSGDHRVAIDCENKDIVYMTRADRNLEGFNLLHHIQTLSHQSTTDITRDYSGIIFPMVDINQNVDIGWLCGLTDSSRSWSIVQALQQTRFQMNEKGAAAQSAVAIHATYRSLSLPKPVFEIDGPFYLWIERPGMSMPLFTAYVDLDDCKEPKAT